MEVTSWKLFLVFDTVYFSGVIRSFPPIYQHDIQSIMNDLMLIHFNSM